MSAKHVTKPSYFLVQLRVITTGAEAIDLVGTIKKISAVLRDYPQCAKCLYKFKVTGETRVLAVYEVTNEIGLERMLTELALLGNMEVTCDPLVQYEEFAKRIGVDESLATPKPGNLTADKCIWAEFNVEYPGKTMSDLLSTWKTEADTAMTVRKSGVQLELFKMCGQRKVHLFLDRTVDEFDDLTFKLPLMQQNGDNTHVITKSLQKLDVYINNFALN